MNLIQSLMIKILKKEVNLDGAINEIIEKMKILDYGEGEIILPITLEDNKLLIKSSSFVLEEGWDENPLKISELLNSVAGVVIAELFDSFGLGIKQIGKEVFLFKEEKKIEKIPLIRKLDSDTLNLAIHYLAG